MDREIDETVRKITKLLEMIRVDLSFDPVRVDDRDEAYTFAQMIKEKADILIDQIGNLELEAE